VPASVRSLTDADLPAVEALLAPTEEQSTFLLGNARGFGITDRGGRVNGLWLGAFEGDRLAGVVSHPRGPDSLLVAPFGHAAALVAAADALGARPARLIGPADRVAECLGVLPPAWRVVARKRETLMVLRWADYVRPSNRGHDVRPLPAPLVEVAAGLLDTLALESGIPQPHDENLRRAARLSESGLACVSVVGGRAVAISMEAATTGRFVHVGGTATEPEARRRGHASACVARILDDARAAGRASDGAVLFTGAANTSALVTYGKLGFRLAGPFEIALLAHDPR
jgi:ribosomal protein S18 acetylase RimI-like enzyme